jgi:hypothetical protein
MKEIYQILLAAIAAPIGYVTAQRRLDVHSFTEGLSFNNTLGSWNMLGSAIPTRGPFSLLPPVSDRAALFMHKQPILTDDWNAQFTISVEGKSFSEHRVGFGFWAVDRDITTDDASKRYMVEPGFTVGRQLQTQQWDLWGFPRRFTGFGVVFSNFVGSHELDSRYQPTVDVVSGTNNELQPWRDVPGPKAKAFDFRNTDVLVEVRYNKGYLTVDCTARGQRTNIYSGNSNCRNPTYIGFAGFTGETFGKPTDTPVDHVKIKSLTMNNYDSASRGEDAANNDNANMDFPHSNDDFIHKYSTKAQERAESKTIVELTHVVNKLVSETEPLRHQMQHAIVTLTTKVKTLEDSVAKLKETVQSTSGHNLDSEFEQMKKELYTLSTYASNQHAEQHDKLKAVHADLTKGVGNSAKNEHMDHLVQQNEELRKAIEGGSSRTFWVREKIDLFYFYEIIY